MDTSETAKLLTKIALYDNRKWDKTTAIAWQETLNDVALVDAAPAVAEHYEATEKWIMPVHVRRLAAVHAQRRRIGEAEETARRKLAGTPELAELEEAVRLHAASWLQWREYKQNQAIAA